MRLPVGRLCQAAREAEGKGAAHWPGRLRKFRHPDPPGKRFGTFWGFWRGGSDQLVEEAVAGFGVAEPGAVEILQ
jgi:hypothetical protein